MAKFNIYYVKNETYRANPRISRNKVLVSSDYVFLKFVEAKDLDHLGWLMQGEVWSPNGEARELIFSRGLYHTSMSVGDVAHNLDTDEIFEMAPFGWNNVEV